jgi:hypothetical protein
MFGFRRTALAWRLAFLLAAVHVPLAVRAQAAPADSGTLVLVISSAASSSREIVRVAGATVTLPSGVVAGTANDSGYVEVHDLRPGRIQLTVRAKDFYPLSCRLNVRVGTSDTVQVALGPERSGAYFAIAGCKQRR